MPRHSNKTRVVAGAVLLGSLVGGCSDIYYDRRETVTFAAGEANAAAVATQIIDPWPAASANRNIVSNGSRVAGAIERYRTGKIIPPKGTGTNSAGFDPAAVSQQGGGGPSVTSASSSAK